MNFDNNRPEYTDMMGNSVISANILEYGFEFAMNAHLLHKDFDYESFKTIIEQMIDSKIQIVLMPSNNMNKTEWQHTSSNYNSSYDVLCEEDVCHPSK